MKLSMSSQEVRRRRRDDGEDGDDFELVASEPAFPTPAETEVVPYDSRCYANVGSYGRTFATCDRLARATPRTTNRCFWTLTFYFLRRRKRPFFLLRINNDIQSCLLLKGHFSERVDLSLLLLSTCSVTRSRVLSSASPDQLADFCNPFPLNRIILFILIVSSPLSRCRKEIIPRIP
jgi:hypothetical protein